MTATDDISNYVELDLSSKSDSFCLNLSLLKFNDIKFIMRRLSQSVAKPHFAVADDISNNEGLVPTSRIAIARKF